jgi:class 3 adenylate cyclase
MDHMMAAATDEIGWRPGRDGGDADPDPGAVPPRHVTLVHSDIVASTPLVAAAGPRYPALLRRHRVIVADTVARWGGQFLSYAGDGTLAVFDAA